MATTGGYSSIVDVRGFVRGLLENDRETLVALFDVACSKGLDRATIDLPQAEVTDTAYFGVSKEGVALLLDEAKSLFQTYHMGDESSGSEKSGYNDIRTVLNILQVAAKGEMHLRAERREPDSEEKV